MGDCWSALGVVKMTETGTATVLQPSQLPARGRSPSIQEARRRHFLKSLFARPRAVFIIRPAIQRFDTNPNLPPSGVQSCPRRAQACAAAIFLCALALTLAAQSVYPTGTTIYDPNRTWNGYTVLSPLNTQAVIVIDMNGNVVKQWEGFVNSAGGPARYFQTASSWRPTEQTLRGRNLLNSSSVTLTAVSCGGSITTSKSKRAGAPPSGRHVSTTTGNAKTSQRATTRRGFVLD